MHIKLIFNLAFEGDIMRCPDCKSENTKKNGSIHTGKPKFECKNCGRQFVENPQKKIISQMTWDLVDKLLLEKIPIAGISRVTGISEPWLQNYINEKYEKIPKKINIDIKEAGRLTIECDEMWSFVQNKKNKQWIWLAIDVTTRVIVGVFTGGRDKEGAQGLWDSLPDIYKECAISYTDFWSAYDEVFPEDRHNSVGKESGLTNHIERFNCTMRQRISRLVRKTLSFSKKLENHIGAIWNFVHHYNEILAPKVALCSTTY